MSQTVQNITQKYIDLLPENDQYYRVDELRSWGFPTFVVRRIKIELQRNLEESMIIPKTDWANIQSDAVQDAWQKFVDAIQAEARLPASYAKAVIETAIADIIDMLVQPRKNIPEVVFGADNELSYTQIIERSKTIVVYPHFANLLPRYMQKKDIRSLSKQQCLKIITKVDKKITARYSPLNWAQMLEPLFKLLDGSIDTNLLRLFFEDKNLPRIARQFDLMDKLLSRAEVIEVLSSPDLLNFEGYEDDQANLFEVTRKSIPVEKKKITKEESDLQIVDTDLDKDPELESEQEDPPERKTQGEQKEAPEEKTDEFLNTNGEEDNDSSLDTGFLHSEEEFEPITDEEDEEDEEDEGSLNASFLQQEELDVDEEEPTDEAEQNHPEVKDDETEEAAPEEAEQNEEGKKETPMWMRYMSEEEIEEYKNEQQETEEGEAEDAENVDEDGYIEEPIIDLTQSDATEKEIALLKKQLKGDRDLFVEEIFNGSDRAFDEAVEKIVTYDSWQDVSKFIEKNIFKRNLVDMYAEPAVEFTDRLQSYFLKKTES